MYKIIALIGEAGSGKDTILKKVLETYPHLHEIISCTTRPKRENEREGINYYYLSKEEFAEKVLNGDMLEATCFNDWFYGTSKSSLDNCSVNIGVFNPEGIEILSSYLDIELKTVYVRAGAKERLLRQLNREKEPNVDEIIRRYHTDQEDFSELEFEYCEINNNTEQDLVKAVEYIGQELLK